MSTPTYSVLIGSKATTGSLKNWVNQDNIPSEYIVGEAETEIYRRLRVREMLARTTGSIASGDQTITLPTRFASSRLLRRTGTLPFVLMPKFLDEIEASIVYDNAGAVITGPPEFYGVDASNIYFNVRADQAYTYSLLFYQKPAALAASTNETNILTDTYPRILRPMCMALANEFLKNDAERRYWLQVAGEAIDAANSASDFDVRGMDLRVTPE